MNSGTPCTCAYIKVVRIHSTIVERVAINLERGNRYLSHSETKETKLNTRCLYNREPCVFLCVVRPFPIRCRVLYIKRKTTFQLEDGDFLRLCSRGWHGEPPGDDNVDEASWFSSLRKCYKGGFIVFESFARTQRGSSLWSSLCRSGFQCFQ